MEGEMSRIVGRAVALVVALGASAAEATEPTRPLTSKEAVLWQRLEERIQEEVRGLDGVAGVLVEDLRTGRVVAVRAEETFPAASTIKLALLYELYRAAGQGTIDLAEVTSVPGPRAGGDGVLKSLGEGVRLSWRDLAVLTVVESDNAATNALIGKVGLQAVDARLQALGLRATRLRRRMMDLEAARRGDENVSTPRDLATLLGLIRTGTGLSPSGSADLRAILALEKSSWSRDVVPSSVTVLEKEGDLEGVRTSVSAVELPRRPYVVSVMTTYLQDEEAGEALIRRIVALSYETFDRLDRAADTGRLIEDR
jgi:beta-lactamase class A